MMNWIPSMNRNTDTTNRLNTETQTKKIRANQISETPARSSSKNKSRFIAQNR